MSTLVLLNDVLSFDKESLVATSDCIRYFEITGVLLVLLWKPVCEKMHLQSFGKW